MSRGQCRDIKKILNMGLVPFSIHFLVQIGNNTKEVLKKRGVSVLHMKIRRKFHWAAATCLLIVFCFLFAGRQGIRTYTVLSGSMEPAIPIGTLLVVYPVKPEELESGDIITFSVGGNMTATHRVTSIHEKPDGIFFQTKGDANAAVDGKLVHESQIIGRPVFSIPGGGYLIWFLQKNQILVLCAVSGIAAVVLIGKAYREENAAKKGKYLSR